MNRYLIIFTVILSACGEARSQKEQPKTGEFVKTSAMDTIKKINRTEEEWKKILTPEQYYILRQKGTDAPFKGSLTYHKEEGTYSCAACGNELFSSDMKFDSHCGWPSFDKELEGGKITQQIDRSHGMVRIEILCAKCGSHLGHLFDDGPTDTGLRYCVNSTSLQFRQDNKDNK